MTPERIANIEAHASLTREYRNLPRETQKRLIDDYRREQANGATMTWSSYIAAIMPRLPREARR
jgi:hypothetical protein